MSWLLGGLALLILLAVLAQGFATASVAQVRRGAAILLAVVGLAAFGLLAYGGRVAQAMPVLLALAPLLLRWWRGWRQARRFGTPPGAQASTLNTATLAMRLDLATGTLSGRVRQGRFAGRELGELALPELMALLRDCQAQDAESVPLLESWLDRALPGWRAQAGAEAAPEAMDRAAALAVLELEEGADEAAIRAAHRRLMREAHPDRGGSAERAAQLNRARDLLLG
ncbi:molecular chaperone DnaJ [Pseudoroseomonas rhizosphaerae]|uniref:Molecular chaperone DnaJ n=1 Tax=Teichococcus rhizosphaerae TaxID=1335062 RepID=A0A2C7A947_9PROT|nr:molecular chaperone DnaJ [Pseudoroseomonas rhizosphaerae]PHK93574.1 molecular chaperone DnaJ [Pseudoroseomonas rhizosphaerae]